MGAIQFAVEVCSCASKLEGGSSLIMQVLLAISLIFVDSICTRQEKSHGELVSSSSVIVEHRSLVVTFARGVF